MSLVPRRRSMDAWAARRTGTGVDHQVRRTHHTGLQRPRRLDRPPCGPPWLVAPTPKLGQPFREDARLLGALHLDRPWSLVENAQPAKIELNIEQSKFADEGLGLKAEHITFDSDLGELQVKLPDTLPLREFRYLLAFKCIDEYEPICARQRSTFSMPVFDDQEPILRADVKAPIVIRMGQDSTVAYVDLISTNRFYHPSGVGVVRERSLEELGVSELGLAGYRDWVWVEKIDKIHAGSRWVGLIRVDHAGFWKVLWGYVTWDWERKARDVPVKLQYQDQYGRSWPPVPVTVRIEYEMLMNLAILYYMMVLLVCTVLGNAMRWFVGKVNPSRGSEVRAWFYSWVLAGLFCVVGFLIQIKVEPFGAHSRLASRISVGSS